MKTITKAITTLLESPISALPISTDKWQISQVTVKSLTKRHVPIFNDYTNYTVKFHKRLL